MNGDLCRHTHQTGPESQLLHSGQSRPLGRRISRSWVQNVLMNHPDDPNRVDWLDLGPDPDEGKPPPDPRRHYLWYGAAAVAVVLALALTRAQHGTNRAASSTGSPSRTAVPSSPATSASSVAPTDPGSFVTPSTLAPFPGRSPVAVSNVGHRLLDVPADWELFARGAGFVLRIQLATGRITRTKVPQGNADFPVTFLVGADRVLVRPQDDSPGAVVPDDKPATVMPASIQSGTSLFPGPDLRHMWANQGSGLALLTLDGRPTGTTIEIPPNASVESPDGTGYLLLSGPGGTYAARPGAVHRVTSGLLLATGPTRWLTVECDDSLVCTIVVTERATGAHHTLDTATDFSSLSLGRISPDGRTAASQRFDGGVTNDGIDLLDLDSGLHRSVEVSPNTADQTGPSIVWSPDSRWLFAIDRTGQVVVVNRATGKATPLAVGLPGVAQLALRYGDG